MYRPHALVFVTVFVFICLLPQVVCGCANAFVGSSSCKAVQLQLNNACRYETSVGSYSGLYSDEGAQGRLFTVVQVRTASYAPQPTRVAIIVTTAQQLTAQATSSIILTFLFFFSMRACRQTRLI